MLAYECKNCKHVTVLGYFNEFDEFFCDERCYLEYCDIHHYDPHLDRLKRIRNALTKNE